MGFGRNPHVAKAQAAEQKAQSAMDRAAKSSGWREAARLWERAAEREKEGKKRSEYERNAEIAREQADQPDEVSPNSSGDDTGELPPNAVRLPSAVDPKQMN
jgi:hypothetical protein